MKYIKINLFLGQFYEYKIYIILYFYILKLYNLTLRYFISINLLVTVS